MNLVRIQPRMLSGIHPNETRSLWNEWDRMMDEFFDWAPSRSNTAEVCEWVPRVDIREEKDRYLADFELPGLEKDDVAVTLENSVLTVTGERKRQEASADDKVYRNERFYGKFSRSLRLPDDVDAERIEAGFKNGVLRIAVSKKDEAKPRTIEIK
jgi:HSP20 family protein